MNNKICVVCEKIITKEENEITCCRECRRRYERIYNLIYGGLYRRFNGNK